MYCPVCREVNLVMTERQGIEIDYCPQCRGVWLDRGELDKLIERAATVSGQYPAGQQPAAPPSPPQYSQPQVAPSTYQQPLRPVPPPGKSGHYSHGYYKKKKKHRDSFLDDLFDFFD